MFIGHKNCRSYVEKFIIGLQKIDGFLVFFFRYVALTHRTYKKNVYNDMHKTFKQ